MLPKSSGWCPVLQIKSPFFKKTLKHWKPIWHQQKLNPLPYFPSLKRLVCRISACFWFYFFKESPDSALASLIRKQKWKGHSPHLWLLFACPQRNAHSEIYFCICVASRQRNREVFGGPHHKLLCVQEGGDDASLTIEEKQLYDV